MKLYADKPQNKILYTSSRIYDPEPFEYENDFSVPPKSITPINRGVVVETPDSSLKYKSSNGNQSNIKINTDEDKYLYKHYKIIFFI